MLSRSSLCGRERKGPLIEGKGRGGEGRGGEGRGVKTLREQL